MTAYENFERMLTDYLKLLELSRIKIQDAGSRDEDIVIPTARSIREAYIVTEFLDRFFEMPRSLIRIVGRVCEWNNLESYINEIKDIQAARREAFRPFARLCERTEAHPVVVRDIKPRREWLNVVARFNSLITQEVFEIKWIIAKGEKSAKNGIFSKPPKQTQRIGTINNNYTLNAEDEIIELCLSSMTEENHKFLRALNKALGKCKIVVEDQPPSTAAEREAFIKAWRDFQSAGSKKTQTYQAFWDEYCNIPLGYNMKSPSEMFRDNIGNMIRSIKSKNQLNFKKRKEGQTSEQ